MFCRQISISLFVVCAGLGIASPAFTIDSVAKSATAYRAQGLAYRQQGDFTAAIASLRKSVELAPQDINGHIVLGWTQHLAGKREDAARSLWSAIYLDPFSVQAFNALGIVYLVRGELSHAVVSHYWAAFLKPDNEIAYYNLSLALHRQQVYDLAIANAKLAANLEPSNPHPLVAEAIAHWDNSDRIAAIASYREAIGIDSRYSDSNFLQYLNEAGFSDDQIQTARQVLRTVGN